jgi:hypothetical protein
MLLSIIGFTYLSYFFYKKVLNGNLSKTILNLLDYKVDFETNELPNKMVIVGAHTSIYDFFIGLLFYYAYLQSEYTVYLFMKKGFERYCSPILGLIDIKFKLISVKPTNEGLSHQIIEKLSNAPENHKYLIFLAPEGTRKSVTTIRKGYWYIANGLNIPISFIGIDFFYKKIKLGKPRLGEIKWENEFDWFTKECSKIIPLYPERCHWTKEFFISE